MKLIEHKEYQKKAENYLRYNELYDGEHEILSSKKYLPYYNVEMSANLQKDKDGNPVNNISGQSLRKTRESLSRYTNFCTKIFRKYKSIIFKNDPDWSEVDRMFKDVDSVDGMDKHLIDFIKDCVFERRFIDGDVFILITAYEGSDEPFFKIIPAISVKDWQFSDNQLSLFRYEYEVEKPRSSSQEEQKIIKYSDEYSVIENSVILTRYINKSDKEDAQDWVIDDQITLDNFEEIPIAYSMGKSFISEFENGVLDYHMQKSSHRNSTYHQGTQKIFVTGNVSAKSIIAMGESTVSILSSDDGTIPNVTSIDPINPQAIESAMHMANAEVLSSAFHMTRILPTDSKQIQSADTLEAQKEELLEVIIAEVNQIERLVNKAIDLYWQFLGQPSGLNGEVQFDKDISIKDLDFQLRDELAYLDEIRKSAVWYKTHMKRVALRQDYENEDEVIADIEANSETMRKGNILAPQITLE